MIGSGSASDYSIRNVMKKSFNCCEKPVRYRICFLPKLELLTRQFVHDPDSNLTIQNLFCNSEWNKVLVIIGFRIRNY